MIGGGGIGGGLADLVLSGGDVVLSLLSLVTDSIGLVLALVSQLVSVSESIPWLPAGAAEGLLAGVGVLFIGVTVARLVRRARDRITD